MSAAPSRLPIVISSLALIVSISGLWTTWRLTSDARIIEFAREKYALLYRIERAVLEHEKMFEATRQCSSRHPDHTGLRSLRAKYEAWSETQRTILDFVKKLEESPELEARVRLIRWSSMFDSSFSEETARKNRELVEEKCPGLLGGG
jgi:hypothetical protein